MYFRKTMYAHLEEKHTYRKTKSQKNEQKDAKTTQNHRKKKQNQQKQQKITNMENKMLFLWYFCMYKCGYTNTRGYTAYKSMKYKI